MRVAARAMAAAIESDVGMVRVVDDVVDGF